MSILKAQIECLRRIIQRLDRIEIDIKSLRIDRIEREIWSFLCPIQHFSIEEITMVPIAPGFSPVYTATPSPEGSRPAPGKTPVWSSSDPINAPVSASADGLEATVSIPATAVVGDSFILEISYTNPDGSVATGSLSQTIVAAPAPDITSFTIVQTA